MKPLALILLSCLASVGAFAVSPAVEKAYRERAWAPKDLVDMKVVAYMGSSNPQLDDNIESGSLKWNGKKWELAVRIGVWGVSSFSRTTRAEWQEARQWQIAAGEPNPIRPEYFAKTLENGTKPADLPKSFEDVPQVAQLIRQQLKQIEASLNTDFLETKFEVFFLDESKLVSRATWGLNETIASKINDKLMGKKREKPEKPFLPFKYSPIPKQVNITPGEGDPYTWPELMGHELFHLLCRDHYNDGYVFADYPLQGVMNGGRQFELLRKHGAHSQLLALEFNTLAVRQLEYQKSDRTNAIAHQPEMIPNYASENDGFGLARLELVAVDEAQIVKDLALLEASYLKYIRSRTLPPARKN